MHWKQATFVALDFETTGRGNKSEKVGVCEIGAVCVSQGAVAPGSAFVRLVNPEEESTVGAYHVHKLRFSELQGYPSFQEQQPILETYIRGMTVIAHHPNHEKNAFRKAGMRVGKILCTCRLAKVLEPRMKSYKLSDLVRELGLREQVDHSYMPERGRGRRFHTAYYDALAAAHLFVNLMETHKPSCTFQDLKGLCEYRK